MVSDVVVQSLAGVLQVDRLSRVMRRTLCRHPKAPPFPLAVEGLNDEENSDSPAKSVGASTEYLGEESYRDDGDDDSLYALAKQGSLNVAANQQVLESLVISVVGTCDERQRTDEMDTMSILTDDDDELLSFTSSSSEDASTAMPKPIEGYIESSLSTHCCYVASIHALLEHTII